MMRTPTRSSSRLMSGIIASATRRPCSCDWSSPARSMISSHLAGWGFILCAAFITFDVLARRFFGFSSQSTTEITGYALAFGISWGLAHTLTARAHVRIDVLINHLPPPLRYPMHLLSLAALGVFVAFIAWGAYALIDESLLFGATDISLLRTPLWLPQ